MSVVGGKPAQPGRPIGRMNRGWRRLQGVFARPLGSCVALGQPVTSSGLSGLVSRWAGG